MGVKQIFIEDLREEFVRDYVFPMFRCVCELIRCLMGVPCMACAGMLERD